MTLMLGASAFLTAQLALQDRNWSLSDTAGRLAVAGLVIWALALVVVLGPWMWRRRWQALEDERTRHVRARAFFWGYCAMLVVASAFFVLSVTGDVGGAEATHLVLAVGVAVPMFGFAILD